MAKLMPGINDLATLYPEIAQQAEGWDPSTITTGSKKKVLWKCSKKHTWLASVNKRVIGRGCPYCSGKKAGFGNDLKTLFPKVARQWHPSKNGALKPEQFTPGSSQRIWWKCPKGDDHEWIVPISARSNGDGCPFCSGRKADQVNNLLIQHPDIAKQWHPSKNKNLKPEQFRSGSNIKVWWKCQKGDDHEWIAPISARSKGYGCPFCSGKKVSETNNLKYLYPKIASEWHPTKNGELKPDQFTSGSGVKVWWRCSKYDSHDWPATIHSRTGIYKTGCPQCSPKSSTPEYRLFTEIASIFPEAINSDRSFGVEFDIYLPKAKIAIEHDGSYFHKNKEKKDRKKNIIAETNGISLFRVRQYPLKKIEHNDFIYKTNILKKKDIDNILLIINRISNGQFQQQIDLYLEKDSFSNEAEFKRLISFLPAPPLEKSFLKVHPEIAKEWHPTKNLNLVPELFDPQSNAKVWWKCPKGDDHEWVAKICNRTTLNRGCPHCSGRVANKKNNFKLLFPELSKEWDEVENGKSKPEDFTPRSKFKAWWKCPKGDDHKWNAMIQTRTDPRSKSSGCPYCAGKKASKTYNLKYLYPDLIKQWHPTKNGELKPEQLLPGSDKKVWWQCPKDGHEWIARTANRTLLGRGCPECARNRVKN